MKVFQQLVVFTSEKFCECGIWGWLDFEENCNHYY